MVINDYDEQSTDNERGDSSTESDRDITFQNSITQKLNLKQNTFHIACIHRAYSNFVSELFSINQKIVYVRGNRESENLLDATANLFDIFQALAGVTDQILIDHNMSWEATLPLLQSAAFHTVELSRIQSPVTQTKYNYRYS